MNSNEVKSIPLTLESTDGTGNSIVQGFLFVPALQCPAGSAGSSAQQSSAGSVGFSAQQSLAESAVTSVPQSSPGQFAEKALPQTGQPQACFPSLLRLHCCEAPSDAAILAADALQICAEGIAVIDCYLPDILTVDA